MEGAGKSTAFEGPDLSTEVKGQSLFFLRVLSMTHMLNEQRQATNGTGVRLSRGVRMRAVGLSVHRAMARSCNDDSATNRGESKQGTVIHSSGYRLFNSRLRHHRMKCLWLCGLKSLPRAPSRFERERTFAGTVVVWLSSCGSTFCSRSLGRRRLPPSCPLLAAVDNPVSSIVVKCAGSWV